MASPGPASRRKSAKGRSFELILSDLSKISLPACFHGVILSRESWGLASQRLHRIPWKSIFEERKWFQGAVGLTTLDSSPVCVYFFASHSLGDGSLFISGLGSENKFKTSILGDIEARIKPFLSNVQASLSPDKNPSTKQSKG